MLLLSQFAKLKAQSYFRYKAAIGAEVLMVGIREREKL